MYYLNLRLLIVCFSYQKKHFFELHEAEIKKRGGAVNFYLLDEPVDRRKIATRRGISDIPYQSIQLARYIQKNKINNVISITPKAGLLVLFAKVILSLFCFKVSNYHWFTGQVWCNDKGFKRIIKKIPDILLDKYSNFIFLDSFAQVNFLKNNNFKLSNSYVPNKGSINGVSEALFKKYINRGTRAANPLRIGVVGRLCEDKGIDDLMRWQTILNKKFKMVCFCFYGDIQFNSNYYAERFATLIEDKSSNWLYLGADVKAEDIYNDIDLLLMCSKREGFSNVLIEAQSFGVPVIVRNIYGVQGSYLNDVTGVKFEDISELINAINFFENKTARDKFGEAGRDFVANNFKSSLVVPLIVDKYFELILGDNFCGHQ